MTSEQDPFLISYLADRDVLCPQCEYNLRDLRGNNCPECSYLLELGLVAPEAKAAAIAGVIGLSAGVGFNALFLTYFLTMIGFYWDGHDKLKVGFTLAIPLAIFAAVLFVWLQSWRAFHRRPTRQRWWLAMGCWFAVIVDLIVFTYNVS